MERDHATDFCIRLVLRRRFELNPSALEVSSRLEVETVSCSICGEAMTLCSGPASASFEGWSGIRLSAFLVIHSSTSFTTARRDRLAGAEKKSSQTPSTMVLQTVSLPVSEE
jgi:hypothetical protein